MTSNCSSTSFSMSQEADITDPDSRKTNEKIERLFRSCYVRLGGTSNRIELIDEDYNTAFDISVRDYRMMSSRSVFKTFGFLLLDTYVQQYQLPESVDNVTHIVRNRGFFATGAGFDPFNAATANLILRNARPESGFMGIATYDFYLQYENTLEKVFAREIQFIYRRENHTLYILQMPKGIEQVVLECVVLKSYDELLNDHMARKYIEDMTLANMKIILGRKYSKFNNNIPSVQGAATLGGDKLLEEGTNELKILHDDILLYRDGGEIPFPVRG